MTTASMVLLECALKFGKFYVAWRRTLRLGGALVRRPVAPYSATIVADFSRCLKAERIAVKM